MIYKVLIKTCAQALAKIVFLFCSVKFFLCLAEAPGLSDPATLTMKCIEPSAWGFFPFISFNSLTAILCLRLMSSCDSSSRCNFFFQIIFFKLSRCLQIVEVLLRLFQLLSLDLVILLQPLSLSLRSRYERTPERVANEISFGARALPLSICLTVYTSRKQLLSAPGTNWFPAFYKSGKNSQNFVRQKLWLKKRSVKNVKMHFSSLLISLHFLCVASRPLDPIWRLIITRTKFLILIGYQLSWFQH